MRIRGPWRSAAALAVLVLAVSARAEVKEVAELFPAQTLACVEVRQPERLAREVEALLKNSDIDDMPAVMSRFRERMGDNNQFWSFYEYGSYALMLSPEILNECGRIQGAAVAVTGVNKDGPEIVGVILSGDSNIPTLYMRGMLSMGLGGRSVAEVEGVHIYRERRQKYEPFVPGQQPKPPTWEDSGPFMAMTGPAIVIGSSLDGVQDVIRRWKGKSTEPSLANVAAYKEAAHQRDKPGLFAYADLASLAQRLDDMGANLGSFEPQWRLIKAIANAKAVHGSTASLTLINGVVELKARVELDARESSPLADLLGAKGAAPDELAFTPRDGMLTLHLNLNDGEKRCQKLMNLMDALSKPRPGEAERPAPSAVLKAAEDRIQLNVAKDVLGRLASAAVVVEPMASLAPHGRPVPLVVLQANDADAAKYLEGEGLPKLIGLAAVLGGAPGQAPAAVREDVDGRSIQVVAAGAFADILGAKNIYIGREGAFVVVGSDSKEVVAALNGGAKKEGLLGDEKAAAAIKDLGDVQALAVLSSGNAVVEAFRQRELAPAVQQFTPVAPNPPPAPTDKPPAEQPKLSKRAEQTIADVKKVVEPLPPAVFSLKREPDALTLEARQAGLKGVTNKLIDQWIESGMERILEGIKGPGS